MHLSIRSRGNTLLQIYASTAKEGEGGGDIP